MRTALVVGVLLTTGVAGVLALFVGRQAAFAGAMFGLLATVINLGAVAALKPAIEGSFQKLASRWAVGMALRLCGVALWLTAVLVNDQLFPPLPSAVGYLGVLIPLLFAEMRFVR